MAVNGQEIVSVIRKQIKDFGADLSVENVGTVVEVGDGIARVHGLSSVGANELVEFDGGIIGMALNLDEDGIGVVILGDPIAVKEGSGVRGTGNVVQVPVGDELIGRVIDALGNPIDGKGAIKSLNLGQWKLLPLT
ncbi:MAG: hypothetical protein CM1200mP7_0340 [Chloroflexota bacterium]|nr:MAG: hypothetical protein CM1200mP7_0340 [Chloroflexota bacterium]